MNRYYVLYKPYQVLSQFTSAEGKKTLADIIKVPVDIYPVGRLDYDSEGLLLLTNDTKLNNRLLNPMYKHEREYWVQLEGNITQQAISSLQAGPEISIEGRKHKCLPCMASILVEPPDVPERVPPIRFRKEIPTSWIKLILHEGKNRQVRKMTAKVGFPTLRLIRYRIENITIAGMQPGHIINSSEQDVYHNLFNHKTR